MLQDYVLTKLKHTRKGRAIRYIILIMFSN